MRFVRPTSIQNTSVSCHAPKIACKSRYLIVHSVNDRALFDLEVKEDYQPTPTDGEVELFRVSASIALASPLI